MAALTLDFCGTGAVYNSRGVLYRFCAIALERYGIPFPEIRRNMFALRRSA
jgi:hypothetical protein